MNGAFTCPHCGRPGVTFMGKLISAAATIGGWPVTCAACGQRSNISSRASWLQLGILVLGLASIPWFLDGDDRLAAGYLVAGLILAVGLFAPLRKDMLS